METLSPARLSAIGIPSQFLSPYALATVTALIALAVLLSSFTSSYRFPANAPAPAAGAWPVLGSLGFFTNRWTWFKRCSDSSKTGNFSFFAGPHPVVGLQGQDARKVFYEDKRLAFSHAYTTLFGGGANIHNDSITFGEDSQVESGFPQYFNRRLIAMLKGTVLKKRLPFLLKDTRACLDELANQKVHITDPYDSIYRTVFLLTMRTVACEEIANDSELARTCLGLFETLDSTADSLTIMYPWLPTPSKLRRLYAGGRLYFIFKGVIDRRKAEGRVEQDAVQYMMDEGDSVRDIVTFVLGSLFAGQLNSGINAAYIIASLASNPYWVSRVREEVETIATKYAGSSASPLRERLMHVPIEAWESEFEMIDLCLKDSIRLNMPGTGFRYNASAQDIALNKAGTEVIPSGAFVILASGSAYYNDSLYDDPMRWDPARYLEPRKEHEKEKYAWAGWGAGRHPCLGMRFAKLEMSMIVAFFVAYFDTISLCDRAGNPATTGPQPYINEWSAKKSPNQVFVKYA